MYFLSFNSCGCEIDFVLCFSEIYFYAPLCSLWDKQLPHISSTVHSVRLIMCLNMAAVKGACHMRSLLQLGILRVHCTPPVQLSFKSWENFEVLTGLKQVSYFENISQHTVELILKH